MLATFAALAEPSRFRIVELLRGGARPVGEIVDRLSMQQPQVSKHLRVLKDAGLVGVEARAQQRLYQLRAVPLRELHDWLEDYRILWDERFAGLDDVIEDLKERERKTKAGATGNAGKRGKRT
jgi:DNA-binding transcriptional ArsR family regulator